MLRGRGRADRATATCRRPAAWPIVEPADVVVVFDLRRYERWVLQRRGSGARAAGAYVVSLTDSALSPLADLADRHLRGAGRRAPGPSTATSARSPSSTPSWPAWRRQVQAPATARLDRIEAAWRDAASLIDR